MKLYYSLFSGIIYEVLDCEAKNLDEGQIPLKSRPKPNCKCYGRGYSHIDPKRGIYPLCPCMKKHIADGYQPAPIKLLPDSKL
jgi:hypothetical protein